MAANVGSVDRALRLIIGVALIVAPLLNFMGLGTSTVVAYTLMAVGGVVALTAVFGVCPFYSLLGIRTNSET
jgi:hypothetical protein